MPDDLEAGDARASSPGCGRSRAGRCRSACAARTGRRRAAPAAARRWRARPSAARISRSAPSCSSVAPTTRRPAVSSRSGGDEAQRREHARAGGDGGAADDLVEALAAAAPPARPGTSMRPPRGADAGERRPPRGPRPSPASSTPSRARARVRVGDQAVAADLVARERLRVDQHDVAPGARQRTAPRRCRPGRRRRRARRRRSGRFVDRQVHAARGTGAAAGSARRQISSYSGSVRNSANSSCVLICVKISRGAVELAVEAAGLDLGQLLGDQLRAPARR